MKRPKFSYLSDNLSNKKTSTSLKESFTELESNNDQSYTQAGSYDPYQTQASYYQSPTALKATQPPSSTAATYSYQTEYNNNINGYYGYNGYQPSVSGEQAGYQRSQGYRRPSMPNQSAYDRPGAKDFPYAPSTPPRAPNTPSYDSQIPSYVPKSSVKMTSYVPKLPARMASYVSNPSSYVPMTPSYTQGSNRAGISAATYEQQASTIMYPNIPQSHDTQFQDITRYPQPHSADRDDQMGYFKTQTFVPRFTNSRPTQAMQYPLNYNDYATRQYEDPSHYYSPGVSAAETGSRVTGAGITQTGSTPQAAYVRNNVDSNNAYKMQYRTGTANTASQDYTYSSISPTATATDRDGQYQSIVADRGQQYGGQSNSQYSTGMKNVIPQIPSNDVTGKMASPNEIARASYENDLQSPTQNAYPRNNLFPYDFKTYQGNNQFSPNWETPLSPYLTQSIPPEYTSDYTYPAGSGQNVVRRNIPTPKIPGAKKKQSTKHGTNDNKLQIGESLRMLESLKHGPLSRENKLSSIHKLDENGQYPSDMKRYQITARKSPTQSQDAGVSSGVRRPEYASKRWPTRAQTQWNSTVAGKVGRYDSWSTGIQKPRGLWSAGPAAKVDEVVKYNNDVTTTTSQPTWGTNGGNKANSEVDKTLIKNIDVDKVVNKAVTDFLTTHIIRKRKRRKRENE